MMKSMKRISVIANDPAKSDPFGIVGAEGTWPEKKIYYRFAKQFVKESYGTVAKYLQKIDRQINPDFMLLETNNRGKRILKLYQDKYNLPIKGVFTSSNLTEKSRRDYTLMDKPFMYFWFRAEQEKKTFLYAKNTNDDIEIFIDQITQMRPIPTGSGVTYKAQKGRHDDLFMAGLIAANFIRIWWEELDYA